MNKVKLEIEVEIPEGYEATGEFQQSVSRLPHSGFIDGRVLIRKIRKFRKPVLPADSGKPCKFRLDETAQWSVGILKGWYDWWYVSEADGYGSIKCVECEVVDED